MKLEDLAGSEDEVLRSAGQHQEKGRPEIFPAMAEKMTALY